MVELRVYQVPKDWESSGYLMGGLEGSLLESLASDGASLTLYTYSSGSSREERVVDYLRGELARFEKSEKVADLAHKIKAGEKELGALGSKLEVTKFWNWYLPWRKGPVPRMMKVLFYATAAVMPLGAYEIRQEGSTFADYLSAVFYGAWTIGLPLATEFLRRAKRGEWSSKIKSGIKNVEKYERELASERKEHAEMYAAAQGLLASPPINTVYVPEALDVIKEAKRYNTFMDVNWGKVRDTIKRVYLQASR